MRTRRPLRPSFIVLAALIVLRAGHAVQADQIGYEGFLTTFPAFNTGSGFSSAWEPGGFNVFASNYVTTDRSLLYFGLPTRGGSVLGLASDQITGATRSLAAPIGADNTVAYVSFLVQPQGTLSEGALNGFFGLTLPGTAGELFVGKPGGEALNQYVLEDRGGFGQVASGASATILRTALLVVRAEFLPGSDLFTLYVNPLPSDGEPASGAAKADLNVGQVSTVGIYSTGAFAIDEIRLGTTFADVVPPPAFAGMPGQPNCRGKSVSALAQAYGGLAGAAAALGYPSVKELQGAIDAYCQ